METVGDERDVCARHELGSSVSVERDLMRQLVMHTCTDKFHAQVDVKPCRYSARLATTNHLYLFSKYVIVDDTCCTRSALYLYLPGNNRDAAAALSFWCFACSLLATARREVVVLCLSL